MRKVDLDDLERKATAAQSRRWRWDLGTAGHKLIINADDAAHIAAYSPPVTLALIARIRELESAYGQIVDDHVRNESDADALAMQALLDKGAVLP